MMSTVQREGFHVPVTAIILTLNEELNIAGCLGCLEWVDDIVMVDSGSGDRTVDIAKETCTNVRVFEHEFTDFGDQRTRCSRTCWDLPSRVTVLVT